MGNIIWLASYPKSGNTWFRLFLSCLLSGENAAVNINDFRATSLASRRSTLDDALGFDSADLTHDESVLYRNELYRHLSDTATKPIWMKVHDAYSFLPNGKALIPPEATRCVIYFIRNPLDIAGSMANHNHSTIDEAIDCMIDPSHSFSTSSGRYNEQLGQLLGTWTRHVDSWTTVAEVPVQVIRFEDMKLRPIETFTRAMDFTGVPYTKSRLELVLDAVCFEKMQEKEKTEGFREKPVKAKCFFRKSTIGAWKEELSEDQCKKLISMFSVNMKKFGYL
jgi:hypothetical protein